MNIAVILAAGVGQRMRNAGLPKQFLKLFGKPIIIYTLEKFELAEDIDRVVIVCREGYVDHMKSLLDLYKIKKVERVVLGGADRQESLLRGVNAAAAISSAPDDVVVIHDGVRPLVSLTTIRENIRVARTYGCAITVHPVTESVVIAEGEEVAIDDFKKRAATYSLSAPQSFRIADLQQALYENHEAEHDGMPLLDAGMVYADTGRSVRLVKEQGPNIKITTPEDFYYLKAMIELEENKFVFGL